MQLVRVKRRYVGVPICEYAFAHTCHSCVEPSIESLQVPFNAIEGKSRCLKTIYGYPLGAASRTIRRGQESSQIRQMAALPLAMGAPRFRWEGPVVPGGVGCVPGSDRVKGGVAPEKSPNNHGCQGSIMMAADECSNYVLWVTDDVTRTLPGPSGSGRSRLYRALRAA